MPLSHILCVDDEEDILHVAQMALEVVGGLRVSTCSNGIDAVRDAAVLRPDCILLDAMMPEMDGPATLQQLRQQPETRNIPIIFMTARVQPKEVQEYLALGAIGVIPKPFDPMLVTDEIKRIWDRRDA